MLGSCWHQFIPGAVETRRSMRIDRGEITGREGDKGEGETEVGGV